MEKEEWLKLKEEYSPEDYRKYVLCDPFPMNEADNQHLQSINEKDRTKNES